MTWTPTPSAPSAWPLLALACFCLATSPAAADTITQADADRIANAMVSALAEQSVFEDWLSFVTYPVDDNSENLASYLAVNSATVADYLWSIYTGMFTSQRPQSILTILQSMQAATNTYADVLADLRGDVGLIEAYANSLQWFAGYWTTYYTHTHLDDGPAWRVYAPQLDDVVSALDDLRNESAAGSYDVVEGLGDLQQALSNALVSLNVDVSASVGEVVDVLEDGGDLTGLGSGIDVAQTLGPADTNTLDTPPVVDISTRNLNVDFTTMNLTGGDSRITFWDETDIGGFTVPAAVLDLASPRMYRAVDRMRDISVTLWWLAYITALFLLCRREVVYYASLAHTEGN